MISSIILVHGAWHDAACWERVTPLLEEAGATVHCPTLRGLEPGYAGAAPTLAEQIAGLGSYIENRTPAGALLVGHSWGGMAVAGVAGRCAPYLRHLMFLDAAVPSDGDDFASQVPGQGDEGLARRRAMYSSMAPDGVWLPPPPAQMVGVTDASDAEWLAPRLRPHPVRTWLEPVMVDEAALAALPKTYVLATNPASPMMGYPAQADRASASEGWRRRDIDCGHDMMVVAPARTAALILEAARS